MMMIREGQTSMCQAAFEPTVSASKQSWPTPQTTWSLGPAWQKMELSYVNYAFWSFYIQVAFAETLHPDLNFKPLSNLIFIFITRYQSSLFRLLLFYNLSLHTANTQSSTLTPRSRVLFKKLVIVQQVKKFSTFYGALGFVTMFTKVQHKK
jgi:hypothetical protein